MASELEKAVANLGHEIDKWNNLRVRPDQAIAIDFLMFNSRFHALLTMLEEAKLIDRDELEMHTANHMLGILKERREEIEPEIHKARRNAILHPGINGGKLH